LRTYAPKPFAGLLVNALADGRQVSERVLQDSRKGWAELARGPYQECVISGQHHSVFDAENAPALASLIRSAVQAVATARQG
jgi:thioesterase domain-containing protein